MSDRESRLPARLRGLLWILAAAAVVWLWLGQGSRITLLPAEGAPRASSLELIDLDGRRHQLAAHRGSVVVLNLWASWCGPCRAEIPGLARVEAELGERGVVVLGLNDESLSPEELARIGRDLGITYPVVVAGAPRSGTFRDRGLIPHTWLIDRQGRVRVSHSGFVSSTALLAACKTLLAESRGQVSF
jgi:thiol-disulfide isomerase/thioredoxin